MNNCEEIVCIIGIGKKPSKLNYWGNFLSVENQTNTSESRISFQKRVSEYILLNRIGSYVYTFEKHVAVAENDLKHVF